MSETDRYELPRGKEGKGMNNDTLMDEQIGREWEAWQDVVKEWDRISPNLDFNDSRVNGLMRAIVRWGERLAALRATQALTVAVKARHEAEVRYNEIRERNR